MQRTSMRSLTLVCFALAAQTALMAQDATGQFQGVVRGKDGKPLAGAQLHFSSVVLQKARTVRADAKGFFRVPLLPPGPYTVVARLEGFNTASFPANLPLGQVSHLDVTLTPVASLSATVEVVDVAQGMDKTDVKTSSSFGMEALDTLPMGRSLESAMSLAPSAGVSMGSYTIRGATYTSNRFMLNGTDIGTNTDGRNGSSSSYYVGDAVAEIQVIQSPIHARYGNFTGGIVNAVTKVGGNEFTGILRSNLGRTSWSALSPQGMTTNPAYQRFNNAGQSDDEDVLSRDYSIWVGGPILKDRLWFSAATRMQPQTANVGSYGMGQELKTGDDRPGPAWMGVQNGIYSSKSKTDFWEMKLTLALNANHTLEFGGNSSENKYEKNGGGMASFDLRTFADSRYKNQYQTLGYRGVLGSNLAVETRWARKLDETITGGDPSLGDPVTAKYDNNVRYLFFNALGDSAWSDRQEATTLNGNVTWFGGDSKWGQHQVDVGFEGVRQTRQAPGHLSPTDRIINVWGHNADDTFRVAHTGPDAKNANADNYVTLGFSSNGKARSDFMALYANDLVTLNKNWQVMGGVRYDRFVAKDTEGHSTFSAFNYSPRLQITFDPAGDSGWILRGSYAIYVGKLVDAFTNYFTLAGNPSTEKYLWKGARNDSATLDQLRDMNNWDLTPTGLSGFTSPKNRIYDSHVQPPSVAESSVSARRNMEDGSYIGLTYTQRTWKHFYDNTLTVGDEIKVPLNTVDSPQLVRAERWNTNDRMKRDYKSLELEFSLRLVKNLTLGGNYTRSTLKGNSEGGVNSMSAVGGDVLGNYEAVHQKYGRTENDIAPYGYLSGQSDYSGSVHLTYAARAGKAAFSASLLNHFGSGSALSLTRSLYSETQDEAKAQGSKLYNQYPTTYTQYYGPRNWWRQNPSSTCDLKLTVEVPLISKVKFFTELNVNNVFNHFYLYMNDLSVLTGNAIHSSDPRSGYMVSPYDTSTPGAPRGFGTYSRNFGGNRSVDLSTGIKW